MKVSPAPLLRVLPLVCISMVFVLTEAAKGQLSLTVLHSFQGGLDGQQPQAALVQAADGVLYGTTYMGGSNNAGTIFRVNPDGSGNTPIYHFPKNSYNPGGLSDPSGLIQGTDGALYGTSGGGGDGWGSVFRLKTDGTGYTNLHVFSAPAGGGGYQPSAALVQGRDGSLYGTTMYGGWFRLGTVFRISADGSGFAELHAFGAEGDAQQPMAPLIQGQDGFLYGTTSDGGASALNGASGYGAVFKIDTNGATEMVLHSFLPDGGDGQYPFGGLVQGPDGTLYGVTQQGGRTSNGGSTGFGTVFKLSPDGSNYAILHNFDPTIGGDGKYPWPGLAIGTDGALYGTADRGGGTNDSGVVFKLKTDGSDYTVLYTFGATPGDGSHPRAPLIRASDGGLFGTAPFGGGQDFGTLFRLAPAPPKIALLSRAAGLPPQLSITSAPHFSYRVEASTDHVHWTVLTNLVNPTGVMLISDPEAPKFPSRFYRAAWVP